MGSAGCGCRAGWKRCGRGQPSNRGLGVGCWGALANGRRSLLVALEGAERTGAGENTEGCTGPPRAGIGVLGDVGLD